MNLDKMKISRLVKLLHWLAQNPANLPIHGRTVLFLFQYVLITPPALYPHHTSTSSLLPSSSLHPFYISPEGEEVPDPRVENNCPNSYVYAYDETSGTALWTCDSTLKSDYRLTFCPYVQPFYCHRTPDFN